MTTLELTNGRATLEARANYLLVVETGTLVSPHEVYRYVTELELACQRLKVRSLLVDARANAGEESTETRDAMWRWLRTQRYFDQLAYALRDGMTIARVNMTALSERLPVRAFATVAEAHRWLARSTTRASSTTIPAVRGTTELAEASRLPPREPNEASSARRSDVTLRRPAIAEAIASELLKKRR